MDESGVCNAHVRTKAAFAIPLVSWAKSCVANAAFFRNPGVTNVILAFGNKRGGLVRGRVIMYGKQHMRLCREQKDICSRIF